MIAAPVGRRFSYSHSIPKYPAGDPGRYRLDLIILAVIDEVSRRFDVDSEVPGCTSAPAGCWFAHRFRHAGHKHVSYWPAVRGLERGRTAVALSSGPRAADVPGPPRR